MTDIIAEGLKAQGNEAFTAKRFEDAVLLYDKAIEASPGNYVYYNNRAAANHELRNYDQAIADAKKAIEISDNAKAHVRIGAALWAQKKLKEAKAEFEKAVAMDPANASAKDNVQKLENLLKPTASRPGVHPYAHRAAAASASGGVPVPATLGGEFASVNTGKVGLGLVVTSIVTCGLCAVCTFVSPAMAVQMWQYTLVLIMAHQGMVMHKKDLLHPNLNALREWTNNYSSLVFMLCLLALLSGIRPVTFIPVFLGAYNVVDVINRKEELQALVGPAMYNMLAPYIQKGEESKLSIIMFAATIEALLLFTIMLSGGAIFTLVYLQYGKNRYRTDAYVQLAFTGLRMNVTRATRSSFMPAFVDVYVQKFCDLLAMLAAQPF